MEVPAAQGKPRSERTSASEDLPAAKRLATMDKRVDCPKCGTSVSVYQLATHMNEEHDAVVEVRYVSDETSMSPLVVRERPEANEIIERRVNKSARDRSGDWRYSVMPSVVPHDTIIRLSADFLRETELLTKPGNTFGAEFEQQYEGHRNYFYYINCNRVVDGSEATAPIFEELDQYTRTVVDAHHPGVRVRLERAFGAYYEGGRDDFHRGVSEHCDGDGSLVSTVVHATLPDGDVGFASGGELTISEIDGWPTAPVRHANDTVGSVVYLGPSVFHHASPINEGGRRLVFCMFYGCEGDQEFPVHAFASGMCQSSLPVSQ